MEEVRKDIFEVGTREYREESESEGGETRTWRLPKATRSYLLAVRIIQLLLSLFSPSFTSSYSLILAPPHPIISFIIVFYFVQIPFFYSIRIPFLYLYSILKT